MSGRSGLIRVVIADDQRLVRSGLRAILDTQDDIEVVGEAEDGSAAIALAVALRPDVVLMDIRMPGLDGLAATRAITAAPSAPRVIVITTYDLDEYLFDALRAGAAGFLLKDLSAERLIDGIRGVAAGDCLLAPQATRRLVEQFVRSRPPGPGDRTTGQRLVALLTPREVDVLRLMAAGRSNTEIAEELIVGHNTVKTHVGHILTKLGARDRVQAVIAAYEADLAGSDSSGRGSSAWLTDR